MKGITKVQYKKRGSGNNSSYEFKVTFIDKEVINFLALVIGSHKDVKITGQTLTFKIDRDEHSAGVFIDFARTAGILK